MELANLSVLGEDEVGLLIQIMPTDDDNALTPENVPAITNQGEAVYNAHYGDDEFSGGLWWAQGTKIHVFTSLQIPRQCW